MYRLITSTLFTALAAASLAGVAQAQSTPGDPLGINALDDTSIQVQRGSLQGGVNSSLGMLPDTFRDDNTVSGWSLDNGELLIDNKAKDKQQ